MKNILATTAIVLATTASANALTIKSGEVLLSDGSIAPVCETVNAQRNIERDGYHLFAKTLCLEALDVVVVIPVIEFQNLPKPEIKEFIVEEVKTQVVAALSVESDEEEKAPVAAVVVPPSEKVINEVVNKVDEAVDEAVEEVVEEVVDEVVEDVVEEVAVKVMDKLDAAQIIADVMYNGNLDYTLKSWEDNNFGDILDGTYDGSWEAKQDAANAINDQLNG